MFRYSNWSRWRIFKERIIIKTNPRVLIFDDIIFFI